MSAKGYRVRMEAGSQPQRGVSSGWIPRAVFATNWGFLHIPSKRYIPTGQSGFVFGPNGVMTVECIGSMAKTLVAWQVYRKVYLLIPSDFQVSFHAP
jgi:hypothetical protein